MEHETTQIFLEFFLNFEKYFLPSVQVDFLLFLINLKPSLRTKLRSKILDQSLMQSWCEKHGFSYLVVDDFFYLGRQYNLVFKAAELDLSNRPHERELGAIFGYPECCCKKIAKIGEMHIDEYENELLKGVFNEEFHLINTSKYRQGYAFISHVPCTSDCQASLKIAKELASFLESHNHIPLFKKWTQKVHKDQEVLEDELL